MNTKDPKKSKERTKINEKITEILEIVPQAQYVGYTATPFANVFISPDETDKVDLFPSDFVLSLPRVRRSTWACRSSTTSTRTGKAPREQIGNFQRTCLRPRGVR